MHYALISSHDDSGDGCHRLFFGSLAEIASALIAHCRDGQLQEELDQGRTLGDLEEEYVCDFDSYHDLADSDDPTEQSIQNFEFSFSGANVSVIALASTYADLTAAFNAYADDICLDWHMLPNDVTDPEELAKIDHDLCMIGSFPSPYFKRVEE